MGAYRLRHWAHPLAGVIAGFSFLLHPNLPLPCLVAFIAYEVVQDWRCGTNSYLDIREAVIPFFIVIAGLLIWRLAV